MWLLKGGHSCLDPFSPVAFVSFPSYVVFHLVDTSPDVHIHQPWTMLLLEHCQALFLGSSFTPIPPHPAYQRALVREVSLLRSSSEEVIQLFGVACLWEAQVTHQKAEAVW